MKRNTLLAIVALFCAAGDSQALEIVFPQNVVLPWNVGSIEVQIFVTGGDQISGLDWNSMTGTGGPAEGQPPSPEIDTDLEQGIFHGQAPQVNQDPNRMNGGVDPENESLAITTLGGTISANGLLAVVTISRNGVAPGIYPWGICGPPFPGGGPVYGDTEFIDGQGNPIPLTDCYPVTIEVQAAPTPEPSSIILGLFAMAGLAIVALRRRRAYARP